MKLSVAAALVASPLLLTVLPSTAVAQTAHTSATQSDSAVLSSDEANKVICKREKVSGSRLAAKKVCMTAAEWERQRRDDQQMAEQVQSARWKAN